MGDNFFSTDIRLFKHASHCVKKYLDTIAHHDPLIGLTIGGLDAAVLGPLVMANNMVQSNQKIAPNLTTLKTLYRGAGTTLFLMPLYFGTQCTLTPYFQKVFDSMQKTIEPNGDSIHQVGKYLSPLCSGALASVAPNVLDNSQVYRINLQKGQLTQPPPSTLSILKSMYAEKGIQGIILRGWPCAMGRFGIGSVFTQAISPDINRLLTSLKVPGEFSNVLASLCAGVLGAVAIQPFDRGRFIQQREKVPISVFNAIRLAIKEDGASSLFRKGLWARLPRVSLSMALASWFWTDAMHRRELHQQNDFRSTLSK